MKNTNIALSTAKVLLPKDGLLYDRWATVACDQYTAEPEYWQEVEAFVGQNPSALRLTLPEIYLNERAQRVPAIHEAMHNYLSNEVKVAVEEGFVLVERETTTGTRPGLLACVDLDRYDFTKGSATLIRATEGTVIERVPPRAEIRAGAPMELPHVMMLIDDAEKTVIEPLLARKESLRPLYDFDLMQNGGHIRGWAVENDDAEQVFRAMEALYENCNGLLFAVGDGNHSLAAAKKCWQDIRETLSEEERENHPARFAMVELSNLHCPTLIFEPIFRVLFNCDPEDVVKAAEKALKKGFKKDGKDLVILTAEKEVSYSCEDFPVGALQAFLDEYVKTHPGVEIDYIHGEDSFKKLATAANAVGFAPRAFDKAELFGFIRENGVLPRKSFSMGEASDKRYYLEMRTIV